MKRDIVLDDYYYFDEFVAIFGIGLIKCLQEGIMSIDDAEDWLFNPVLVEQLKRGKFSKEVRIGVDLGTEWYVGIGDLFTEEEKQEDLKNIYKIFKNFIEKNIQEKPTCHDHLRGFRVKPRGIKKK